MGQQKVMLLTSEVTRLIFSEKFALSLIPQLQILSAGLLQVKNWEGEQIDCSSLLPIERIDPYIYLLEFIGVILSPAANIPDACWRLASLWKVDPPFNEGHLL